MATSPDTVRAQVDEIADAWREQRAERQRRTQLDRADFDALRDAGLLRAPVPEAMGGLWRSMPESTRVIAELLRTVARVDPSVALVSSMHPAVIGFWLCRPDESVPGWEEQRAAVFETAAEGRQWGTITSEPGSGGDVSRTKAVANRFELEDAVLPGATYVVSGDKHFGSGSGVTDFMITSAVPDDGDAPVLLALDVRSRPWDGSAGLSMIAEWDGVGMAATQSHAMRLDGCPAIRMAWPGPIEDITIAAAPLISSLFTAVVLGVLDEAVATARAQLGPKAATLRAYEQVEWSRAELDHWLAVQAYEGALRAVESGDQMVAVHAAIRAKQGVAELAEQCLQRLGRVIGGGTFSRRSPFAAWFEDVRALGFLRPPWGLAYDTLFLTSF